MADRKSIGAAIKEIKSAVPKMAGQIRDLAKAEIKPAVRHGAIGAFLIGAILVVLAIVFLVALLTIGFALSIVYNQVLGREPITALALGFLTLAVLCLVLIVLLAILAWRNFKKVKAPEATIAETKASLASISSAIERGLADGEKQANQLDHENNAN